MFTTWDQVKEWIEDNNFPRWIFYNSDPDGNEDKRPNNKIVDSNNFNASDFGEKLEMTEKYLRRNGGKLYGLGFKAPNATVDGFRCEVRLSSMDEAPAQSVGVIQPAQPIDEDKIAQRIEAKLRAEYEKKEYERKREELDKERKAFEAEKASAMGAIAHYFAPIGQALLGGQRRMVAGVDTQEPVKANVIQPITTDQQTQEEDPFTDEEADELFALMARFKKVEPEYMTIIHKVVEMAEAGDATYTMAKKALLQ